MPLSIQCGCGKTLKARDELAGKKVKCPACQATVELPSPALDLMPEPAPPPRLCPQCKAENPADQQTCSSCGAPAGPFVPGPTAGRARVFASEQPFEKKLPFALMALGMVYRPWFVLEYFRGWAQRRSVLIQLVLLYVGSLAALAVVAAAGYMGPGGTPEAPVAVQAEKDEEVELTRDRIWKSYLLDVGIAPSCPTATKPFRLRIGITEYGKAGNFAVTGTAQRRPVERHDLETGQTISSGKEGPVEKVDWKREGDTRWHHAVFMPSEAGEYVFRIEAVPPVGGKPAEFSVSVQPAVTATQVAAKVVSVGTLGRIVFTILSSILGVAIAAGAINIASKMLGEGGEFLFLAVVLIFVESIVNLGSLAMLAIVPLLGPGYGIFVTWGFGIWQIGLTLLAIMKVYEFDLGAALLTSAIAAIIKLWAAAAIVGTLFDALT